MTDNFNNLHYEASRVAPKWSLGAVIKIKPPMGCFDYNRAGQLNLQFVLTWKMAHMENLFARHRFELIMLILWFYYAIWLGLQMKSQSDPLQELWCECQVPAALCGVPVGFPSFLQHKGRGCASAGGGGLSHTHCRTIAGCRHKAPNLIT